MWSRTTQMVSCLLSLRAGQLAYAGFFMRVSIVRSLVLGPSALLDLTPACWKWTSKRLKSKLRDFHPEVLYQWSVSVPKNFPYLCQYLHKNWQNLISDLFLRRFLKVIIRIEFAKCILQRHTDEANVGFGWVCPDQDAHWTVALWWSQPQHAAALLCYVTFRSEQRHRALRENVMDGVLINWDWE